MKKLLLVCLSYLLFSTVLLAQTTSKSITPGKTTSASAIEQDTIPPYKKDPHIPRFSILLADSTSFTKAQLPKYDYTAIIYFSPDCGHCQYTTKEIVRHMDSLKNVFFVFVAYKSVAIIKEFVEAYGLNQYPNIRVGHDPLYYVPSFFRVSYTPHVAIYDKSGSLLKVYDPPNRPVMEVAELIELVNPKK